MIVLVYFSVAVVLYVLMQRTRRKRHVLAYHVGAVRVDGRVLDGGRNGTDAAVPRYEQEPTVP